jgi:hypothetical protein
MLGFIDVLEDALMGVEMELQDSLSVSTAKFFEMVKKINEDMKAKT